MIEIDNVIYYEEGVEQIPLQVIGNDLVKIRLGYTYNVIDGKIVFDIKEKEDFQEKKEVMINSLISKSKEEATNKFLNKLKIISDNYTNEERLTFDIKVKESEKVANGEQSEFLEGLCIEGETVIDLAGKILNNSTAYQMAYAEAEKEMRQELKDIQVYYKGVFKR